MLKALLTDIDGTITDSSRRINTGAIESIRSLVDDGVEVVLASGNTSCFMDALCKMIGTKGTFIAENGGVFRVGFTGTLHIKGDQAICRKALDLVQAYYRNGEKSLCSSAQPTALRTSHLPVQFLTMKFRKSS